MQFFFRSKKRTSSARGILLLYLLENAIYKSLIFNFCKGFICNRFLIFLYDNPVPVQRKELLLQRASYSYILGKS